MYIPYPGKLFKRFIKEIHICLTGKLEVKKIILQDAFSVLKKKTLCTERCTTYYLGLKLKLNQEIPSKFSYLFQRFARIEIEIK